MDADPCYPPSGPVIQSRVPGGADNGWEVVAVGAAVSEERCCAYEDAEAWCQDAEAVSQEEVFWCVGECVNMLFDGHGDFLSGFFAFAKFFVSARQNSAADGGLR